MSSAQEHAGSDLAMIPARELYAHPGLMGGALDVAQHLAKTAALMQRWPEMERAVDMLIERQRTVVQWWRDAVRQPHRPLTRTANGMLLPAEEAERLVGLTQKQMSRVRAALRRPDHRERLLSDTRAAALTWTARRDPSASRPTPARDGPDFWPTPACLIAGLLWLLPKLTPGPIWECASGDGRLQRALQGAGREVFGSDLYPQDGSMPRDFLAEQPPVPGMLTITNPPFNRTDAFLHRGLELLDQRRIGGFVLLLRHDHLTASGRATALNRATVELHCNWRPVWIAGSEGQPRWSFCWVSWLAGGVRHAPLYLAEPP